MRRCALPLALSIFWLFALGAAAQDVPIGGRVLVPGGAPLPEASVRLFPLLDPLSETRALLDTTPREAVARATTGAEGRFQLVAPRAGLWEVRVDAPGFVPLVTELKPLIEPVELPDAELAVDTGLTVRVKGSQGSPLPGALVVLRSDGVRIPAFLRSRWTIPPRSGRVGDEGLVKLARAERESANLSAWAPGWVLGELRGVRGTAATIELASGAATKIQVQSADGKPAAGVLVAAGQHLHPLGLTDPSGLMETQVDPARPVPLSLLTADGRRLEARLEAARPKEDPKPRRLVLPARVAVTGRLIDADSRRPIAGGVVWDMESPIEAGVSDEAGTFVLGGPAGRRLEITSGAAGYMNGEPLEFQLGTDRRPGPTLALWPAAVIEGKVVDGDGQPVSGADIELQQKRNPGRMTIEMGRPTKLARSLSNARGSFRLSPVDPDKSYVIKAAADKFAPAEQAVTDLQPRRTKSGVKITLSRGQSVTGTIVDGSGRALREVSVELKPTRSRGGMPMMPMFGPEEAAGGFTGTTDEQGRFAIRGLPAGKFDLKAMRQGFAKRTVPSIELEDAGEGLDVGEIALTPGVRLQGLVLSPERQPVEGVEVFVTEGGPRMMFGRLAGAEASPDGVSDPAGWFAVEDLAAGEKYAFRLRRPGYVDANLSAIELPRSEPLEVVLEPASKLSGLVSNAKGEPIAGAEIRLSFSRTLEMGGNRMQAVMMHTDTSDTDGRFLFEDLEPGTVSVKGVASGYQEAKLDNLEIPQGQDLEGVDLRLNPGAMVQGRVLGPDGRPAIGATVRLVGESSALIRMDGSPADGEGNYRLEGLAAGTVSIEATHGDYPRTVKDLQIKDGLNKLDLQFEGGFEVAGRVTDTSGIPVGDAVATLSPAGRVWGGHEARTKADGSFSMPGVLDGDYQLWIEAESYAPLAGERRVSVSGAPVSSLEVQLERGATLRGRIGGLEPEQYAKVQVRAERPSFRGSDRGGVDYQGNYRLENLGAGAYTVVAALAGTGRQARGQVTVEAGAREAQLDLQFGTGLTLSGKAVQGERPVAGAMVFVEGLDVDHNGSTQTDPQGVFSIEGLEPGKYRAGLRNFRTGLAYNETVELSASREIVLRVPTARVAGQITDATDQQPLAGVAVSLLFEDQEAQGRLPTHNATTDVQGRFEVANVADGRWKLSASKKGYAASTRPVDVQFDKPVEDLQLSLQATEGLTLEARLPSGGVPSELRLAVLDPAGGALISGNYATGENGRVRLSSVPAGSWEIIVSAPGSATSALRAQAPGETVAVALRPASRLKVVVPALAGSGKLAMARVQGSGGQPFRTLSWTGQPQAEWPMDGGQIEFASLPPGSWSVSVAASDGNSWQGSAVTTPGSTVELRLE